MEKRFKMPKQLITLLLIGLALTFFHSEALAFAKGACINLSKQSFSRTPASKQDKVFKPGSLTKVLKVGPKKLKVAHDPEWRPNDYQECAQSSKKKKFKHINWISKESFEKVYLWDELNLANAKDKGDYSFVKKSSFLEIQFDNETLEATLFAYGRRKVFSGRPESFQVFVTGLPDYPLMIRTAELDGFGTELIYAGKNDLASFSSPAQWNSNNTQSGGIDINSINENKIEFKSRWFCLSKKFQLKLEDGNLVPHAYNIELKSKEGLTPKFKSPFQVSKNYQAAPGDSFKITGYNSNEDKVIVKVSPIENKKDVSDSDLETQMSYTQLFTHSAADFSCG
jgi:hypothetical protein